MAIKNIRIECAPNGSFSRVFIDGVQVEHCHRVMLDVQVEKPPRLTLGIYGFDLVVTGQAEVVEIVTPAVNVRPPDCESEDHSHCSRCGYCEITGQCVCYSR